MGQKKALFYKYFILTKRQWAACGCQVVTPLLCLALIKAVIFIINDVQSDQADTTVPSLIYPANLLTPKWQAQYSSNFQIQNPVRINRWSAPTEELKVKFEDYILKVPDLMNFKMKNSIDEEITYPQWKYYHNATIKGLNQRLIDDLKEMNVLNTFELKFSEILPDCSYLISRLDQDTGITANIQINNVLFERYHRRNGDQTYNYKGFDSKTHETYYKKINIARATESSIGHMNLLTNMHIQSILQDDLTNVISVISPTVDASILSKFVDTALSFITINLFPTALCLGFPIMLFVLVMEKEEKIKDLLDINGLVTINYWITFFVYNFIQLEFTVIVFLTVAKLFIDIDFFQKSSILLIFWYLSAWNVSQIGFALFISSFVKKSSSATLVGYTISIFLILFLALLSLFLFPSPSYMPWFTYAIPQTSVVRFFYIGISRCIDSDCITGLGDFFSEEMLWVVGSQHALGIIYFVLGICWNEPKIYKKFLSCGCFKRAAKYQEATPTAGAGAGAVTGDRPRSSSGLKGAMTNITKNMVEELAEQLEESQNVGGGINTRRRTEKKHQSALVYERQTAQIDPNNDKYVLVVKGMSKSFPCPQGIKHALSDFSIKIEKGKIFGLLGPNGAGKTTFLSLVTGTQNPDRGAGWICGNSTQDRTLHSGNIGFCPQFDILWPLLNVEEHLIFLAMFKGIDYKEAVSSVENLIEEVDLHEDYLKMSSQLSGGMKRRCSLAMALTGDPKIIFLDEPSSGLDPVKRRHFWQLVKKVTKSRAVLLTTHLMEEADTLCNEIAIITTGKMRCIGNSIYLKNTFTDGMKIQVVLDKEKVTTEMFMDELKSKMKNIKLDSEFQGILTVVILEDEEGETMKLSEIFDVMYDFIDQEEKFILDWSISLGSLEDVFLNVVRKYRESNIVPRN